MVVDPAKQISEKGAQFSQWISELSEQLGFFLVFSAIIFLLIKYFDDLLPKNEFGRVFCFLFGVVISFIFLKTDLFPDSFNMVFRSSSLVCFVFFLQTIKRALR